MHACECVSVCACACAHESVCECVSVHVSVCVTLTMQANRVGLIRIASPPAPSN